MILYHSNEIVDLLLKCFGKQKALALIRVQIEKETSN